MIAALAVSFTGCGGTVENKPANTTNTNTAKPVAAAPTTDILLGLEKAANEAYSKGDSSYFETLLSDKMIMSMGKEHMNKAGVIAMIKTAKCELTDGVKLSEPQMSKVDNDTYAFSYKNDSTGKCSEGGKMVDMKPARAATLWVRNGDKWQAAWHGETEIIMPKGGAKSDAKAEAVADVNDEIAKKDTGKKADAGKDVAKKEEVKKAEPKKDEVAKKEEPKKDEAKKDDKAANTAPAPAKPVAGPNTDALTKLHQAGWEAWKNKDAKWFEANTTATLAFVDPAGKWFGTKADVIKEWTDAAKCTGVTKVSVTDGFATALSPTIEIFDHKGTADGTCDGQKNGALWGTAVYVKEGADWKLAFLFETPGM